MPFETGDGTITRASCVDDRGERGAMRSLPVLRGARVRPYALRAGRRATCRAPIAASMVVLASLFACARAAAEPQAWSVTFMELMHGAAYELIAENRTTLNVSHANGGAWGDFYGFVDLIAWDGAEDEIYTELYLQFSLSGLAERSVAFGPIADVDIAFAFRGSTEPDEHPFRQILIGVSIDVPLRGFLVSQIDIHAVRDDAADGVGYNINPVWDVSVRWGELPLRFRGYIDFLSPKTAPGDVWQILAQPQFLLDVGSLLGGSSGQWYAGVEYSYWHNKFGVDGVHESVAQALLLFEF